MPEALPWVSGVRPAHQDARDFGILFFGGVVVVKFYAPTTVGVHTRTRDVFTDLVDNKTSPRESNRQAPASAF